MQATALDSVLDRLAGESQGQQLAARKDPVLGSGEPPGRGALGLVT